MRPVEPAPHRAGGSSRCRRKRETGFVTAETAVVIPSLVLLITMLIWGVMTATAVVRCVDGAGAGARAAARGEGRAAVHAAVRRVAPEGSRIAVSREGEWVRVRVRVGSPGPGPLSLPVRAEAVALAEGPAAGRAVGAAGRTKKPTRGEATGLTRGPVGPDLAPGPPDLTAGPEDLIRGPAGLIRGPVGLVRGPVADPARDRTSVTPADAPSRVPVAGPKASGFSGR